VLFGRLGFRLGDETAEVGPGGAVHVPPGVAHTFWNADAGATRSRDRATLAAHFAAHASELL
jgi:uncharacterized RmlC-like cupin family protein